MLGGSVAALAVLGAPDLVVLTLTELADLVRRICRNGSIPLVVDGDHGYGNALNARRTLEELEAAGAAGVTIEDTDLPASARGPSTLLPASTVALKIRAAVDARCDRDFAVIGRTNAALTTSSADLLDRLAAYQDTGCQALFIAGLKNLDDLDAVAEKARLPMILAAAPSGVSDSELAARGVRIWLQGHQPSFDAFAAAWACLYAQRHGDAAPATDPRALAKILSGQSAYAARADSYLPAPPTSGDPSDS